MPPSSHARTKSKIDEFWMVMDHMGLCTGKPICPGKRIDLGGVAAFGSKSGMLIFRK